MKIKTFILTFLLVMSCPFLFGQSRAGETPVTTYDGIISAIKQSQESGSLVQIYLKSNVEVAKQILIPENAKISIDLNDFVLSSPSDVYIFKNLGELTITDSQYGGGTIESRGIANGSETKAGKLTINGGNFIHNSNGGAIVYNYDSGEATITAGTFIGGEDTPVILNKGTMFIQGVDAENRVVIKENGSSDKTITCFAGSKLEIANAYIYGADIKQNVGSEVTIGDNVMYVKAEVGTMQGENFKAYKLFGSLKDAVAKASEGIEGNVVNLLYNTPETDIVEITAPITINGNNKTLTSTAKRAINVNVDDFKTDDVVTIKDLTIVGKGTEGCERGINIIRTNEVTEPTSPIVKIDNVDVSGVSHYAVHVAKTGAAVKVNINDSDLSAWGALAVYGEGTVCNVTNSNLTGNNTYTGNSDDFATIAFDNINVEINVNGGTVTAKSSDGYRTQSIVAKKEDDAEAKEAKVVLNTENLVLEGSNVEYFGGEFDEIDLLVSESLVETLETAGYALGTPAEGLVAVTGIAVAKIDDTYYTSLKEALVAVANNQTIEIVANNDEGSITYPIKDDVVYGTDEEYANNFDITTKEGFEYEFAESSYKLVFTNGVKVTFDNANIKGVVNSFGNETEITLAGNNNIKTLQSSNGGTYSVAEGEQKIGTLQGELKVSGEPKLAINAAGVGSKLVIEKATLNGELPANIDVVAQGKNNIINTAIKGGNFVVAENAAVEVNADMTDLASFYFNNGAAVTVNEDSEFTVDTVEVAKDAVVTLNFKGNASFKSTTNDGTINLYMKEGTTFTTNNIDDTDGVSFVATTDENCEIFYEEGAYKAIRILNDGDVAMIGKVGYPTLQAAIDACTTPGNYTIVLLRDIAETSVEIDQTKDINITIDGGEETRYDFSGTMCIHGKSNYTYTETLKIKNIDFFNDNLTAAHDFISSNDAHDGHVRYAHNVTIENCNFSVPAETKYDVVAMRFRQAFNISVIGGEFKNLHSVMWTTGTSGVKFDGIAATDCKNGMHIGGGSNGVIVNNSSLDVENYGIRAEGQGKDFSIDGSTIKATIPVVVRKTNEVGSPNFTFGDNTMTPNNSYNYWFVAGIEEYEGGETLPTIAGQVVVNIEEDSNLSYEGVYGSYCVAKIGETQYQSLELALQAVKDGQTIEIIAEGTESNVVYPAADAEEGIYAKEFAIKSVGEGANYQVSVLFQKDVNVDLTDAVIYDLRSFDDAVISLNNTTVNGMLYSKNNKAEVTGGNVTINKLYSEDGQDGAIKVTGTTNLVVKQNIGNPIINMTDVTLSEATSLPAGTKVVFNATECKVNTVNKSGLASVSGFVFNGNTTFIGVECLGKGTIEVAEGVLVKMTEGTSIDASGVSTIAGTLSIENSQAIFNNINVDGNLNVSRTEAVEGYTFIVFNAINAKNDITLTNVNATINTINVPENVKFVIDANSTVAEIEKLAGKGALEILGTAKVKADDTFVNEITEILLNGADAKFYAPEGLTNVKDINGLLEPKYEDGYYSLDGTYVAEIVKDGITYQFRTIKSALASDHFNGEITLINDTKEDNFNINKIVTFKTESESTINIKSKAWVTANKTLTIAEGANIQFNYLTNMGTVTNKGKLVVKATLENQGSFTNNATITAETLENAADVTFTNNGTIEAATVTNYGTISNAADKTLTVNGTLTNDGTITNNGTLTATNTFTNGNIFNNGTANNKSGKATLVSVSNNGTINNYATLNVTEFTANVNDGVQLYAGSINVEESLSGKGSFLVNGNGNGMLLDNNTQLTEAIIYFVNNTGKSTINNAVLTGSSLTVGYGHELTINGGNNSINSLTTNYNSYNSKATVNVSGTLTAATVTNHATLNVTDGSLETTTLTNNSTGTITNKGTLTATTVTNSNTATISNAAGKSLTVNGTLTNNGTITNGGSLKANKVINNNNENNTVNTNIQLTNISNGTLTVNNGGLTNNGSITISSNSENNKVTGTLTNNGTITVSSGAKLTANTVSNQKSYAILNVYGNFVAESSYYSFTNGNGATINVTGNLTVKSNSVENYGTVNVEGTSAVINIDNSVSNQSTGTFNMTNVKLTTGSKLMNANIVFDEGTYYSQKSSTISGATLTDSKLTVKSYHTLEVKAGLALGNGTLTNNGIVTFGKDGSDNITLSGTTLTNSGTLTIQENGKVEFTNVTNSNEINVLAATLNATSSFTNNRTVNVKGLSKLSASVTGNGTFEMNNVSLDGDTKLNDANINFSSTDNQVASSDLSGSTVIVNSDAVLTLNGAISVYSLTNNGTIEVNDKLQSTVATNSGIIYLNTVASELIVRNTVATPILGKQLDSDEYDGDNKYEVYYDKNSYKVREYRYVAKIGDHRYSTLEDALNAAGNDDEVELLYVENYPVVMKGEVVGKNVKITTKGNIVSVDWSKGSLFVGRSRTDATGDATLTFDNAQLTSESFDEDHDQGINISGEHYDGHAYDGTVVVNNSEIEVDYILVRNSMTLINSTVTVKGSNGYKTPTGNICNVLIGGRPASETGTGDHAIAYLELNNSTLIVQENIRLGYEGKANVSVSEGSHVESNSVYVDSGSKLTSTGNILASMEEAVPNAIVLDGGVYKQDVNEFCKTDYTAYPCVYNGTAGYWNVRMSTGEQTIQLVGGENGQGWNWISSYISTFNLDDLQEQLSTYATGIVSQAPNMFSQYQEGSWSGLLEDVSPREMYKVQVTENINIAFEGDYVDYGNYTITLYPGYNWIGYPVSVSMMVSDAFVNPAEGDMIYTNGDEFAIFESNIWDGDFELVPGHGYIYYYAGDSELEFTYPIFVNTDDDANNNRSTKENKRWNASTSYANSMRMIAMVSIDGEVVDGNYEVAAFADGELRGSARPVYVEAIDSYVVLLNVNGNNAEELTFKYYDVNYGTEYVLSNRINFTNNALVGSMDEPYMLTLDILNIDEAAANEISIYPNPTTTDVEINLNATCDTVEVFNALGVKVAEYSNVDSIDALETAGVYVIRITNDGNVQNCRLVVK